MTNRPRIWDETKLHQAISLAEEIGSARVELPTDHDAQRFRLRLYDYRKANNIGQSLVITLNGNYVILTKSVPEPAQIIIGADPKQ